MDSSTRPGLTGAWQVNGRNDTTYSERVAMDEAYVTEWRFLTDVYIILATIPAVAFKRGAF